ncbi:MAG: HD domain-containing phosphohydrolase [Turicibacter sp.]
MKELTLKDILDVFTKYLNYVDPTLSKHSEDVTYLFLKMLQEKGHYTQQEIMRLCTLAMFHDIGAYKKNSVKEFLEFEINFTHDHSIYGSLFIKFFSPLADLSDIILYHHVDFKHLKYIETPYKEEALMLNLIDMIAVILAYGNKNIDPLFSQYQENSFMRSHIDLFKSANAKFNLVDQILNKTYHDELYSFFSTAIQTREQIIEYAKMLNYTIDFQSESTVNHTITVTSLSKLLAKKLELPQKTIQQVTFGATLHDIGKITTPLHILEKPGKLDPDEMEIMKQHVTATFEILKDIGFSEIVEIASYHHEKLDGSGYPFGLTETQLSLPVRTVIVADILSALIQIRSYKKEFSKEEVLHILLDLSAKNKIDSTIVSIVERDYDELIEQLNLDCHHVLLMYKQFKLEYKNLTLQFTEVFE